jgi:hypothetical protein
MRGLKVPKLGCKICGCPTQGSFQVGSMQQQFSVIFLVTLLLPFTTDCDLCYAGIACSQSFLFQILKAVHHAHMHCVMHRDLKPQNILVDASHTQVSRHRSNEPTAKSSHRSAVLGCV